LIVQREKRRPMSVLPCSVRFRVRYGFRSSNCGCSICSGMASLVLVWCLVLGTFAVAFGSPDKMKGPYVKRHHHSSGYELETSVPRIILLGSLLFFQRYISPVDGERCGFFPSCSAFAREALGRRGVATGVMMTADRLMRCTFFKRPGPDYLLLPSGKLFDPVDNNLLSSP
jgi:putative component of membrane protein insertase Oxa1/YidC/SpoIIIJ protein YidD